MVVVRYVPDAGDIVWVDYSGTRGHEQAGRRPAVVVSVRSYTKASGLCTVCPITSQTKGYANEVSLTKGEIVGTVLSDQHKTIDIDARALRRVGKVSPAVLADIRTHIGLILGIIPA